MSTEPVRRIVWAVDPFGTVAPLLRTSIKTIADFAKATGAFVEPVYVFEEAIDDWAPSEELEERIESAASGSLGRALRRMGAKLPKLMPMRVLRTPFSGTGTRAQKLIDHAKENGPSLIVAASHARRGVARWVLGSFAENLMLRSEVPLVVVNPKCKGRNAPLKHVLFATDFSEDSHRAFGEAVAMARMLKARMTVLHVHLLDPLVLGSVGFVDAGAYHEAFAQLERERRAQGESWAAEARAQGVRAKAVVDSRTQGSVADVILRRAAKDPGIIAMGGRSGAVGAVLVGSVTRQVARGAQFPVWMIHPRRAPEARAGKDEESKREKDSSRRLSATLL